MMFIRPIARADLGSLMDLARAAGVGLTSLPVNEERLSGRIERSVRSFAGELPYDEQGFVFVLEDADSGHIAGICALESAVGMNDPWYNYRIGTIVHSSQELGVYKRHEALFLSNDHTGFSELCTLFLHPDYRVNRNGSLLSKSRFLFLAQFADLFGKVVVAEMRGVSDEHGQSPFWEGLGRNFFAMDFDRADYLTGVGQKTFVAELMPKHPIYIDLLPESARKVIREPHANTRPALSMLEAEGFRCEGYVDIFDGGPTVQAYTSEIRAVRDSRLRRTEIGAAALSGESETYLVSSTNLSDFRVLLIEAGAGDTVQLTREQADVLKLKNGDLVRCVALCPQEVH
jgi:arginine N-succinyltransferase